MAEASRRGWIPSGGHQINLEQAHTLLADAARLAMRLVELGLDPKVKAYAQISAISEAFKVLQQV